jgi:hypothetical protein
MPDQEKSTLPPLPTDFDSRSPLRETFLRYFSDEDAKRFRYLGHFVFEAFMEGSVLLPKEFGQSDVWREVNAALGDLRFVQHYLAEVAISLEESCLDLPDTRLALLAADLSVELGKLGDRMEGALR